MSLRNPDIPFYMRHSQNFKGKLISFTRQCVYKDALLDSYIQIEKCSMIILMFKLKLFEYISQNDLPNSLLIFIAQRLSMKGFVEWKCLALVLSKNIIDNMHSSLWKNRKRLAQNGAGSIQSEMSFNCFIVTFPTLK